MQINVLEYLDNSVLIQPHKSAFIDIKNNYTYQELSKKAKMIGSNLSQKINNCMKRPIAVLIDRSIEDIAVFFGIIYSGNFYVPIDPDLPANRIGIILKTLQPLCIIVLPKQTEIINQLDYCGKVIEISELYKLETDFNLLSKIKKKAIDTDPVYTIYTSGSTGIPKGVVVSHRSIIDLIDQFAETFHFTSDCVFGNQAPFDFDISVKDIFSTIKSAATACIIPKSYFSFPVKLIEALNEYKVNTIIWATSLLRIVANFNTFECKKPLYLNKIMFSGEVMPIKILNYWRKYFPEAMFVNLYGPTEITCNCTYYIVNREFQDSDMLPIGIPFRNSGVFLFNENNQLANEGELGEICVTGSSLALGYYNNFEQTAQAFCQNPLNSNYPELIYRTGDLGKYNELHELLFLSRKDNQIKHQGHRIELNEIECALNSLDFVDIGCCIFDKEEDKIVLFYQSLIQCNKKILIALGRLLPKYMIPNVLMYYETLPLNKNSKIDKKCLKEEYFSGKNL